MAAVVPTYCGSLKYANGPLVTGASINHPNESPLYIPLIPSACSVHRFRPMPNTNKPAAMIVATVESNSTN